LGDRVIAYGENGVSVLTPVDNAGQRGSTTIPFASGYNMNTIYRLGMKSKHAIDGTESFHFFVDKVGQLCKLTDGLEILGYAEFLSPMSDSLLTLSYDIASDILYICDGTYGYVYNVGTQSLGEGPPSIAGIDSQDGTLYVSSLVDVDIPSFELWTDIIDVGTRESKTVEYVEVGIDLSITLYASIKYRTNKSSSFNQTRWQYVDPKGRAYLVCYGREFQFGLKTLSYEYFEIDYLKVHGVVNAD